eukprot:1049474-Pyramimonas_sp.AAC.1
MKLQQCKGSEGPCRLVNNNCREMPLRGITADGGARWACKANRGIAHTRARTQCATWQRASLRSDGNHTRHPT